MRAMTILTVIWLGSIVTAFVCKAAAAALLHDPDALFVAVILAGVNVAAFVLAVVGVPVLAVGWVAACVARVMRREKSARLPAPLLPREPGLYQFDKQSQTYRRVPPPC